MKKFTALLTALAMAVSSTVMAKDISNFQDLLAVMKTGKTVFALVDYSKCTTKQKGSNPYNLDVITSGIRMDHLYELTETRSDGKRMNVIGFSWHNWVGSKTYTLTRQLIHVWEDNVIDVVEDSVDPATFKLVDRDWSVCRATGDGSGGVTFTVA